MSAVGKYIYTADGKEQPLYYLEGGAGWPVLLLHGWGCSSETMLPVFQHLAADFHVYCFDLQIISNIFLLTSNFFGLYIHLNVNIQAIKEQVHYFELLMIENIQLILLYFL